MQLMFWFNELFIFVLFAVLYCCAGIRILLITNTNTGRCTLWFEKLVPSGHYSGFSQLNRKLQHKQIAEPATFKNMSYCHTFSAPKQGCFFARWAEGDGTLRAQYMHVVDVIQKRVLALPDITLAQSGQINIILASVTRLVSNINPMNTEVAHAASEQTSVTENISRSLNDLAGISGSASADSASLAQSGERLFQQGERLRALVNLFRL